MTQESKPQPKPQHFYEARREDDGLFIGVVYHYDNTGNRAITVFKSKPKSNAESAEEEAVIWAENLNLDVEPGISDSD